MLAAGAFAAGLDAGFAAGFAVAGLAAAAACAKAALPVPPSSRPAKMTEVYFLAIFTMLNRYYKRARIIPQAA
ncbi:MAG: hypothetical protein E6K53_09195 [Gammaproteobacteria bacterium]|nr:MAG: hypothetical protein E6K53_09195 [Gammaproteobacteria bacterium]